VTHSCSDLAWPLHSARLTIRPACSEDLAGIGAYRRLPDVSEWLPTSPATAEEHVAHISGKPDGLQKTLVVELDGTLIGDLFLSVEDGWAQAEVADRAKGVQAEIGWCLDPAYQGKGYAAEAVAELIRACFEDLGIRRVVANSFADNTASWRLMERLGMRRELYTVAESLHRTKGWVDGVGYALLADEWRAQNTAEGR